MKRAFVLILSLLVAVTLISCSASPVSTSFFAMDTYMTAELYAPADAGDKVADDAKALEALLSATDDHSEIFELDHTGCTAVSDETLDVLLSSLSLCERLSGDLDISVYPLVELWGFPTGEYRVPDDEEIAALLPCVDYSAVEISGNTVTLPENAGIDLGAVAKGYLADKARADLGEDACGILNLGGTIASLGQKPSGENWSIGVADPDDPSLYFGVLSLHDKIIATSGGYERYFEQDGKRYIHILDPHTGYPADSGLRSVTAVSDSGVYADALSTALFVKGLDESLSYYSAEHDFDFVILTDDHEVYISEGLAESFRLSDGYKYPIHVI